MVVVGKHFYIFVYCGLVGNPHLTAKQHFIAPLPTSTKKTDSGFVGVRISGFSILEAWFWMDMNRDPAKFRQRAVGLAGTGIGFELRFYLETSS